MKRAIVFYWLSAVLLASSIAAILLNARSQLMGTFEYFAWIHVGVIITCGYATFELRRLSRMSPPPAIPKVREIFSRPMIAAGAIALIAAAPNWSGASMYAGLASKSGAPVTHMSVSQSNGHYYAHINHEPGREIPKAQYDESQQALFSFFARTWVLFSFMSLCLWHVVVLRRSAKPAPEPGMGLQGAPDATAPVEASLSPGGGKSGAVIAALWVLAVGSSILVPLFPGASSRCSDLTTGPAPPLFVLVFPLLFFGVFALFTKRSPYFAPWLAQIVDGNYGPNAYERFVVRLKPMLLFGIASIVGSISMALGCKQTLGELSRTWTLAFGLSAGLAFVLAHIIMRLRKVQGV